MRMKLNMKLICNLIFAFGFLAAPDSGNAWSADAPALPKGLKWETNEKDPVYASPDAVKGGTLREFDLSFPLTLRYVGPDANGSFRSSIDMNRMSLVELHPNTKNFIPSLATHWAYGSDHKTIYFKLDPAANWSDGKPVTADDYLFTMEFMKSKFIVDPWYNNYYVEHVENVIKFDDYTIAVVNKKPMPNRLLMGENALEPTPRHFMKLDENWVKDFNWKITPNTGPYQISEINKGKSITFSRKKDWWAKDKRFFKNRFNVDSVEITIIRDMNIAFEYFKKGELDYFPVTIPDFWHEKTKIPEVENGYIHKLWFYTDMKQSQVGMWFNQDHTLLKNKDIRIGIQHSLNLDKVIETVLRNDYERLRGTDGFGEYSNADLPLRKFDLDAASKAFAKAGFKKRGADGILVHEKSGERLSFEVVTGYAHHQDRLVVLKEEAKKAGLELTLKVIDSATAWKTVQEKKHQIAYSGFAAGDGLVPAYWEKWHSANAHKAQTNNLTNYDDKKMDALITKFDAEMDEKKKIKLSKEILRDVWESGAFYPATKAPYFRGAYWRWLKSPKVPATKSSETIMTFGMSGAGSSYGGLFWIDEKTQAETKAAMKAGTKFPKSIVVDETYRAKGKAK